MKKEQSLTGINIFEIFSNIRKVHKAIPDFNFDCSNCKDNCCVSPYITVAEFIFVVNYVIKNFDKPYKVMLRKNGNNQHGIEICPFLDEGKCSIYPVRHYKCRMTGMDILEDVFEEVCQHKKELGIKSPDIAKKDWLKWVDILTKVNKNFNYNEQHKFGEWIDLYFLDDSNLDKRAIRVRNFLRNYLNLSNIIPSLSAQDFLSGSTGG